MAPAPSSPPSSTPEPTIRPQHSDLTAMEQSHQSRLLLLPTELRLICYEYAFSYPTYSLMRPSTRLALLRTCKQIYGEARLLAFSLTDFSTQLSILPELPYRLGQLREEQVRSIQSLTVRISSTSWLSVLRGYNDFLPHFNPQGYPRLQLSTLTVSVSHYEQSNPNIFLNFFAHWKKRYFLTRAMWMDTQSANKSTSETFYELMLQWLEKLNAATVRVVNEDGVDPDHFALFSVIGDQDGSWKRVLKEDDNVLEISRVEPKNLDML